MFTKAPYDRKITSVLRLILVAIISVSPLFAVAPVSDEIGRIQTAVADDSITCIALKAAGEDYTESWLDEFAVDKISFGEAYSGILSSLLPLHDPIAGEEKNNAVTLKSLSDGTVLTFIFVDGRIAAISQSP